LVARTARAVDFFEVEVAMNVARFMAGGMLLASAVAFVGCQRSGLPPRYSVTGMVTHQGKPVSQGEITFSEAATGYACSGVVRDGQYKVLIPYGTYAVTMHPYQPHPMSDELPAPDIPQKYRKETTSDLKAEVTEDDLSFNFELE
jgi:hypothetical protein